MPEGIVNGGAPSRPAEQPWGRMDIINRLFEDKRLTCVLLMTWMSMVLGIFSELGMMDSHFMKLGPGKHSKVMGVELDTWYKWSCIAVFTFVSTSINAFVGDAIMPWIQNTIQDHKTKYLPYSKTMCILITQIWTLYCCVMSVFALFVMLSQVDFLIIRICADLLVNVYTSIAFMRGKTVDPERYSAWMKSESHHAPHGLPTPQPGTVLSAVTVRHEEEGGGEKRPNERIPEEEEEEERAGGGKRGKSMDTLLVHMGRSD